MTDPEEARRILTDLQNADPNAPQGLAHPLAYHLYVIVPDQNGRVMCGQCEKKIGAFIVVQEMAGQMPAAGIYCKSCGEAYGEWIDP